MPTLGLPPTLRVRPRWPSCLKTTACPLCLWPIRSSLPSPSPSPHPLPSVSQRTCRQQVLAAVRAGRPTALVVDIGNDDTHIIPVVQGTAHTFWGGHWRACAGAMTTTVRAVSRLPSPLQAKSMAMGRCSCLAWAERTSPSTWRHCSRRKRRQRSISTITTAWPQVVPPLFLSHLEKMLNQHLRSGWSDIKHALGYCSTNLELDRRLAAMPQASLPFYNSIRLNGTYLDLLPGELLAAVHHSVHHHSIARQYQAPDGTRASRRDCGCV